MHSAKQKHVLSHTIHTHMQADIHKIYSHRNGLPRFVKRPVLKRKVLSWVSNLDKVRRFGRLAGRKFQTDGVMKLNKHSPNIFKLCVRIFKSFLHVGRRVHGV